MGSKRDLKGRAHVHSCSVWLVAKRGKKMEWGFDEWEVGNGWELDGWAIGKGRVGEEW